LARDIARQWPHVVVHALAASDAEGTATLTRTVGLEGHSSLDGDIPTGVETEQLTVLVARLDAVIDARDAPAFIKIDVEGHEYRVLRGADRILTEHHPVLWFEHGRDFGGLRQTHSADIWDLLTGIGYRIFDADGDGPIDRQTFIGVRGAPMMWN